MEEETVNVIRDTVKELIEKMGFFAEVEIKYEQEDDQETIICNVRTEESSFLIGQHGVNLQALQHIARVLVRKKLDTSIRFTLDVNSYRQERNSSIVKFAQAAAAEAISEKRSIVLRPMSPYERRIVHMELSKNDQIKTESTGEGEERKVVISPLNML